LWDVSICVIQVQKGGNETKQLAREFGKDRATFIKTGVSQEDEIKGLFQFHNRNKFLNEVQINLSITFIYFSASSS
jgi:hypothetical protein